METKKVSKKNKVWIVGWICLAMGIQLLVASCASVTYRGGLRGGPYPPSKVLPKVVYDSVGTTGLTSMGWFEVTGPKKAGLKVARKEAAKLGARVIKLESRSFEYDQTQYEYYTDQAFGGDWNMQRAIGTRTVRGHKYKVSLYR